jgi:DNA-binding MarR family transcriptional regulator
MRDTLGFTAGNLSVQIRTLATAGYVSVEKSFVENKSRTEVRLTPEGHRALSAYLKELELIVASLKAGSVEPEGAAHEGGSDVDSAIIKGDSGLSQGR